MSPDTLLEISQVGVTFGGLRALDDISISVKRGEIRGLIGPNGAGKSTLVNVVAGENRKHDGTVTLDGVDITRVKANSRARLGLARTFQHPEFSERLTMRENLELGLVKRKVDKEQARVEVENIVDRFQLGEWLDVTGDDIPYPVVKIVDTMRVLLMRPMVLLADEPAAGLQKEDREKLIEVLRYARDDMGVTIVLIEHDVPLVFELCETLSVLDAGQLIADGEAEEIKKDARVIEAYLGVGH